MDRNDPCIPPPGARCRVGTPAVCIPQFGLGILVASKAVLEMVEVHQVEMAVYSEVAPMGASPAKVALAAKVAKMGVLLAKEALAGEAAKMGALLAKEARAREVEDAIVAVVVSASAMNVSRTLVEGFDAAA